MEITTNTIAELYIKQGYPEKAIDIYKAILELDPTNSSANDKLLKLKSDIGGIECNATIKQSPQAPAESLATSDVPVSAPQAHIINDIDSQIARLEGWLGSIAQVGRRH